MGPHIHFPSIDFSPFRRFLNFINFVSISPTFYLLPFCNAFLYLHCVLVKNYFGKKAVRKMLLKLTEPDRFDNWSMQQIQKRFGSDFLFANRNENFQQKNGSCVTTKKNLFYSIFLWDIFCHHFLPFLHILICFSFLASKKLPISLSFILKKHIFSFFCSFCKCVENER